MTRSNTDRSCRGLLLFYPYARPTTAADSERAHHAEHDKSNIMTWSEGSQTG